MRVGDGGRERSTHAAEQKNQSNPEGGDSAVRLRVSRRTVRGRCKNVSCRNRTATNEQTCVPVERRTRQVNRNDRAGRMSVRVPCDEPA